ncbi:MAG: helix-turn-helix domain-containing protein [Nitrososphaerales archaeon]
MTLGNAVKLIRTSKGVKQRVLAAELNVSANYLSLIEGGKREPSISFLRALAKELDVPIGMFFLWQEPQVSKSRHRDMVRELRDLIVQMQAISISGQGMGRRDKK